MLFGQDESSSSERQHQQPRPGVLSVIYMYVCAFFCWRIIYMSKKIEGTAWTEVSRTQTQTGHMDRFVRYTTRSKTQGGNLAYTLEITRGSEREGEGEEYLWLIFFSRKTKNRERNTPII